MKPIHTTVLLLASALAGQAQMTRDQRLFDFQALAAQFAKRYAPYEWKKALFGFDLLEIGPWLDRVGAAKDDLDYYEICYDYTAALQDGHVAYLLPSDFYASLGFVADIYDGKPLIESISRSVLPLSRYPFDIGDELVSVDGVSAGDLLAAYAKYEMAGNPAGTRRVAAQLLTIRVQQFMPHAPDIGDAATVVVRRRSGNLETYQVPWTKYGVPLISQGPVITPHQAPRREAFRKPIRKQPGDGVETPAPDYFAQIRKAIYAGLPVRPVALAGFAVQQPVYSMPTGFQRRLGFGSDAFYSGSFSAGGKKIGFIRIPTFEPDVDLGIDTGSAIAQFQSEIAWQQANTDGLIVDVTRNPGGYPDYMIELLRRLIPRTFQSAQYELRATAEIVELFSTEYDNARLGGAPQYVVDIAKALLDDVRQAYRENRGRTGPLALDGLLLSPPNPTKDIPPATDRTGKVLAYSKPIVLLVDETSFSAADMFAAVMQDNRAALLFGTRTAGLGGVLMGTRDTGAYSEAVVSVTVGMAVRNQAVVTPDFPATSYIENVGVRADVQEDYMTADNLLNRGRTYVNDFTAAMLSYLQSRD